MLDARLKEGQFAGWVRARAADGLPAQQGQILCSTAHMTVFSVFSVFSRDMIEFPNEATTTVRFWLTS